MTTFHAQRQIVEHPVVLFDFLQDRGLSVQSTDARKAIGRVSDLDFFLNLHSKRFRGNLSLWVDWPKVPIPSNPTESELRVALAAMKRPLAIRDQIISVLAEIDVLPLDSPIEDELCFVLSKTNDNAEVDEIVCAVREHQREIEALVKAQDFEAAVAHRTQREQLLDSLYDLCASSMIE